MRLSNPSTPNPKFGQAAKSGTNVVHRGTLYDKNVAYSSIVFLHYSVWFQSRERGR